MDETVEISSDSDRTIIFCLDDNRETNSRDKNMYQLDSSDEETDFEKAPQASFRAMADKDLIEKLNKKYLLPGTKPECREVPRSLSNNSIDLTDSPERKDSDGYDEVCEAIQIDRSETKPRNRKRDFEISLSDSSEEDLVTKIQDTARNNDHENSAKLPRVASRKKQDVENAKAQKLLEKAEKKQQLEREKALKAAAKNIQKSTRPEECLKNIIVTIDQDIQQQIYGDTIKDHLRNNQISFKSLPKSNGLISWTRKIQTLTNMMCKEIAIEEKYYLTIISAKEFDKLAKNRSLRNHINSIKENYNFQHLTIVVFGVDKPSADQELAIMEINMFFKCYFQFARKPNDLAFIVSMTTKSVAQIPHKLEKEEKYKLQNEFFNDCNKDTVRVDKSGNGLGRLWHQMLTMFPLARLETAEAITAAYPTPSSLFKAYGDDSKKGAELLQELPIRRAYGPLASVRKIGPELSKKCHNFFTSQTNILL